MKIPKKIYIMGKSIDIKYGDKEAEKHLAKVDSLGELRVDSGEILLQKRRGGENRRIEDVEEVLIHECVHACLILMEYRDAGRDEELVGRLSQVLYQVFKQIED